MIWAISVISEQRLDSDELAMYTRGNVHKRKDRHMFFLKDLVTLRILADTRALHGSEFGHKGLDIKSIYCSAHAFIRNIYVYTSKGNHDLLLMEPTISKWDKSKSNSMWVKLSYRGCRCRSSLLSLSLPVRLLRY